MTVPSVLHNAEMRLQEHLCDTLRACDHLRAACGLASRCASGEIGPRPSAPQGLAAAVLEALDAADFALAAISDHYFRGHPMVLVDQEERLHELIDLAEEFGQLFNAVVNAKNTFSGSLTAPIDFERVKQAAKEHSKVIATALIDAAKKRTLLLLSDPKDAVKALMGKSLS